MLLALATLGQTKPAAASWAPNGVPLCSSPCDSDLPKIISDGAGGGVVVWRQLVASGIHNVVLQRITADGDIAPGWPANGVSASTDPHNHSNFDIAPDGEGGAIVAWEDYRTLVNPPYVDVYAQRITAAGSIAPGWAADGVRLTGATNGQLNPRVCSDGIGGAFVTWMDFRLGSSNPRIYAQHVTGAGTIAPGWPADGQILNDLPGAYPLIVADGSGGAVVAWNHSNNPIAQRITAFGAPAPGWPVSGVLLFAPPASGGVGVLVSDGAGGAIAAGQDFRTLPPGTGDSFPYSDVYAQHVTGAGVIAPGWPADGLPICVQPSYQGDVSMTADGAGGAVLAWDDYRNLLDSDIYLQRVNGDGTLTGGWPVNGMRIGNAAGHQVAPSVVPDVAGGVYMAYMEVSGPSGYSKVNAQHMTGAGTVAPGWSTAGTTLANTGGVQQDPTITADGRGGAIVAWLDGRDSYYLIYAQRLVPDGPVAVALSLVSAEVEPDKVRLTWHAADGAGITATVERRTSTTTFEVLGMIVANGTGALEYVDHAVTPGARYAYRLRYRDGAAEATSSEAWVDVPRAIEFALAGLRPNPAVGTLTVEFSLAGDSPATLELIDITGRRLHASEVGSLGAGRHVVRLSEGGSVAPGVYWLRLTQAGRSLLARGVVVK